MNENVENYNLALPFHVPLTQLDFIAIQGEKASDFLQGQTTIDIAKLSTHHTRLAAFCNRKGRVLALAHVTHLTDKFILGMHKSICESLIKHLSKYAMLSKVSVTHTADYLAYGSSEVDTHALSSCEQPGEPKRYYVLFPQDAALPTKTLTLSTWDAIQAQNNLYDITADTQGKYTPHKLHLPELGMIDFDKGCYVGQEIIARVEYLSKK